VSLQPAPASAAETPASTPPARGGRGGGAPQLLDVPTLAKAFPNLDAKANAQIRMLWIVCGTADGLIGQNRQLKEWLRSKNVKFTELEVPDMAHVWPLWRQNVADLAPKLFRK
jgi:enterochelin esterase family protein